MTTCSEIAADPAWLPHRIDTATKQVEFLRIGRDELVERGFLADRDPPPDRRALMSWDDVAAMQPEPGALHFVFHTAFCRSTLLIRVLDRPGTSVGLNEPGIIASMVNAGNAAVHLHRPLLDLLARAHEPGEAVFVKPTNHANALMPALLNIRPEARAVLMTNSLADFLRSVARKGMMGRRWGRQLYLEMQGYAGMDFGMDGRESFVMTDMQAAGLSWFLAQRWFDAHMKGGVRGVAPERLRVLDSDRFIEQREQTLAAILDFGGVPHAQAAAAEMAGSPVFGSHAKTGGNFEDDHAPQKDTPEAEEIAQVEQWVGMIAEQAGLAVPVPHSLT